MAAGLPPPDADTSYGRYGAGSASTLLPVGTTVETLQESLASQRAAIVTTGAVAVATATSYSVAVDMMAALSAIVEAMRAGITDPAQQVRVLLSLAGFSFTDGAGGVLGIGAAKATMRNAMVLACQQAAVISLANASASYRPSSYDDALALRVSLAAALDAQITLAGDAGQDDAYTALRSLRTAVIRDLTVRGASLPTVVTISLRVNMPSLAIAQRLYKDASRSDQVAASAKAIHPAFLPTVFSVLAS